MAEPKVYVAVNADDSTDMVIKLGPLLWDGETAYDPGPQYRLVLEADALAQGPGRGALSGGLTTGPVLYFCNINNGIMHRSPAAPPPGAATPLASRTLEP
ncbi:hypothetical protein [Streptomyces anulatus]|uniref:hypothetical protein n=1 Tax=Streptomyces anulatus TaxID=1892 RepID=UPI003656AF42